MKMKMEKKPRKIIIKIFKRLLFYAQFMNPSEAKLEFLVKLLISIREFNQDVRTT